MKKLCAIIFLLCCVSVTSSQTQANFVYLVSVGNNGMVFSRYNGETLEEVGHLPAFQFRDSDVESQWRLLSVESITISPDEQHIAITAYHREDAELFIYSIADGSLRRHAIESAWLMPVWSPDSSAVFLKVNTTYYDDTFVARPHGYIYEIATGTLLEIFPRSTRTLIMWLPDSSGLLYRGTCFANDCTSEDNIEFWTISRDGSENHLGLITAPEQALRAYQLQYEPNGETICNFTWSPFDEQWYYEYGCFTPFDGAVDFLISSANGLEIDLSHFQINPSESYAYYRDIVDIVPASDAVYALVESSFAAPDAYEFRWRIFHIDAVPGLEIVYESSGQQTEPQFVSLSPNEQLFAVIGNNGIWVINLETSETVASTEIDVFPHAALWQDDHMLLYDNYPTWYGGEVWQFNVETGESVLLLGTREQPAWLLPTNNLSS